MHSTLPITNDRLFTLLKEGNFVDDAVLTAALHTANTHHQTLFDVLVEKDTVSDAHLGRLIADELHVPFVQLSTIAVDLKIALKIPDSDAKQHHVIAYAQDEKGIRIAMTDPLNAEKVVALQALFKKQIIPAFATPGEIEQAFKIYKKDLATQISSLFEQAQAIHQKLKTKDTVAILPIVALVELIILDAYEHTASDIHIEPLSNHTLIRFRTDGVLSDILKLPKGLHAQILARLKVLSKLRTDEHNSAQDGKILLKLPQEELDIRVSIVPQVRGEKAVLRLLSAHRRSFALEDLGMRHNDLEKVHAAMLKPFGMILSTGPTGSGKTTSVYAVLKLLNTREKNIATIEDPVEYMIEGVNQIQVSPKTNLTFATGLRSLLRQDPDILYVGEIRDEETADIAVNAATTGHLVLSTLHTNNAVTTLPRLLDMHVEGYLVASTVNLIIGQRLVRRICDRCKVSDEESQENVASIASKKVIDQLFGKKSSLRLYKGKGCPVCNGTGFSGRVGLFEVLPVSEAIGKLIVAKAESAKLQEQAVKEGMTTMLDDGIEKVLAGVTTIQEVLRNVKE